MWLPLPPWRIYWAVSVDWHRAERVIWIPVKQDVYCSVFPVGDTTEFLHPSPKLHLPHTAYQITIWHLKQTSCLTARAKGISPRTTHTALSAEKLSCVWGNLMITRSGHISLWNQKIKKGNNIKHYLIFNIFPILVQFRTNFITVKQLFTQNCHYNNAFRLYCNENFILRVACR